MSKKMTRETDDIARGNHVVPTEWAEQLEQERDEARNSSEAFSALAWKLEGERNEAREKAERYRLEANAMMLQRDEARRELSLKQQTLTIAEGTLFDLRKELKEWAAMCGRYKQERDEAMNAIPDGEWVKLEDYKKVHEKASRLLVAINKELPIGCFTLVSSEYYRLQNAIYGRDGVK